MSKYTNLIGQKMSTRLNFRTRNKTIFWSTLVTPKSIDNEEFNQPGQFSVIQFISSTAKSSFRLLPKRLYTARSWPSRTELWYRLKGKDLRLSFINVTRCRQNLKKTYSADFIKTKIPYLRSIIHIYTHTLTHIPTYVSKDNYFYPTYFGQPWNHLFDRLYQHVNTHTRANNPIFL